MLFLLVTLIVFSVHGTISIYVFCFVCSVLVHSGGVHGGHYYAFIRPTLSDQWYAFFLIDLWCPLVTHATPLFCAVSLNENMMQDLLHKHKFHYQVVSWKQQSMKL